MKKYIITSLLFLLLGCSISEKEYDIENLIEIDEIYYEKFSKKQVNGKAFRMFDDKKVILGKIKNRKKEGLHTYWHENGRKKLEVNFKNGKENGLIRERDSEGNMKFKGFFIDGKKDGLHTNWCCDGQIISKVNFKNGKKDGLSLVWHDFSDQIYYSRIYKDGKLFSSKEWDRDGKMTEWDGTDKSDSFYHYD